MDNYFEREFPEVPSIVSDSDYCIFYNPSTGQYGAVFSRQCFIDRSTNTLRSATVSYQMYSYNDLTKQWILTSGPVLAVRLDETDLVYSNYDILSYADSSRSGSSYVFFYGTSSNETVLGSISSGTVANGLLSDVPTVLPFVVIWFVGYIGFLKALKYLHDLIGGA